MFSSSCGSKPNPALPNPNPKNFTVRVANQVGEYCVCLVRYPDCTTFEGDKILVYKADSTKILKRKELDPHFMEKGLSPVARFPATDEGREDAFAFVTMKSLEGD